MAKKTRIILPAYRRNIRKACASLGNRIPQAYRTATAENGDFIVYGAGGHIIGRLTRDQTETFKKE